MDLFDANRSTVFHSHHHLVGAKLIHVLRDAGQEEFDLIQGQTGMESISIKIVKSNFINFSLHKMYKHKWVLVWTKLHFNWPSRVNKVKILTH